jgi:hypothetical protein
VAGKSNGDAQRYKTLLRLSHAQRLENNYQVKLASEAAPVDLRTATYRDGEGRRLAPVLPLPPVARGNPASSRAAQVHRLLAAHALTRIEDLYGAVFTGILGERVTTKPVQAPTPFTGNTTLRTESR